MNPLLRRSAAHVFVPSLEVAALSDDDAHHLGRVLRIRPTDDLTVSDGAGSWAPARWVTGGGLELVGEVTREPPGTALTIVSAIPKGDRPEWMVQKLTELGVDHIGFTMTTRSVVRWDDAKVDRQLDRLRRIAREAAMQSRRVRLPTVDLVPWDSLAFLPGAALAEPDGDILDTHVITIVVGPEGGFTGEELDMVPRTVSLSSLVLRVETAAVTAGVLLRHLHQPAQAHG